MTGHLLMLLTDILTHPKILFSVLDVGRPESKSLASFHDHRQISSQFSWPHCTNPEKAMAPHSSTLGWKMPWTEEPGRLQSMGSLRVTTEQLHFHFSLSCIEEGNGNPLQYSCLENPRDGGAWWAAVFGVTQRRTRLKRLSSSSSSIQK